MRARITMARRNSRTKPDKKRDPLAAAFLRSEWWRNAMIGCLLGLTAAVALLAAGIGHPLLDVVNVVSGVLVLGFVVSFVMAALTSMRLRRAAKVETAANPAQRKAPCPRMIGSSTSLRLCQGLPWASSTSGRTGRLPGAWPAFVVISVIIVGVLLLVRR